MSQFISIKLTPDELNDEPLIAQKLAKASKGKEISTFQLQKKSIDARQKQVYFLMRYEVFYKGEAPPKQTKFQYHHVENQKRVIIVGAGPAGYFAALKLIELGLKPIILDRGKDVQSRRRDLRAIQQFGEVNPHSNYCFGEGGAGTYSDGKLYTRSHKRGKIEEILRIFHDHGASDDVLTDAHPHIGSNKLPKIVSNMRETIESFGGEVLFDQYVVDFIIKNETITGVITEEGKEYLGDSVILATGHSARDIYYLLAQKGIALEAKDFALGVRIEHPQSLIDEIQYNQKERHENLPASSYRIACEIDMKGVFSFCMCPGGLIVPASTAPKELVVNGMSLSRRDSPFSNSGFVTAVDAQDFYEFKQHGVFAGLKYQESIERQFFEVGDGTQKAPAQKVLDFIAKKESSSLLETSYIPGIYAAPLHAMLPGPITHRLREALLVFSKKMRNYISNEAQLIGLESRTSSPIRIPRDKETGEHPQIKGLFPCGEGAGYAGGILSAAMDGQFIAKKVKDYYQMN